MDEILVNNFFFHQGMFVKRHVFEILGEFSCKVTILGIYEMISYEKQNVILNILSTDRLIAILGMMITVFLE